MKKTCITCERFYYITGTSAHSENTLGSSPYMVCDNIPSYWEIDFYSDEKKDVVRKLQLAEMCKDYKEVYNN